MKRHLVAGFLTAALIGFFGVRLFGQTVLTAQINNFWQILQAGGILDSTTTPVTLAQFTNADVIAGGYISFGNTLSAAGYGFRDNGGTMQYKNSGGSWAVFAGSGGNPSALYWVGGSDATLPLAKNLGALSTALVLNTAGVPSAYAGFTCTAQFPRVVSGAGAATCQSVALGTDVTGTLPSGSFPALTGDVTTPGASLATTLASTGVGAGSEGSATSIPTFTVDAKGRLTAKGAATPQLTLTSTYFSSLSAANLTALPTTSLTGALAAANFPALTGDVTSAGATLTTTVGKVGGKTVTLGGTLTTSGAYNLTLTLSGATNVTLPTTGTLLSTTVATLSSLSSIGTITTGIWNATPVTPQYGGTGLATITAHGIVVGEGTSTMAIIAGCTNGVLLWASSSVDPTCATNPVFGSPGATTAIVLGGTGVAGAAATAMKKSYLVTGLADAVATPLITVTVPNAANAATLHIRMVGSLGGGGAIGAFECSNTLEGNIVITRTAGVATVATASTAAQTATSCVAGATTETLAYSVSAITGAVGVTQTFTVNGTVTKGGGASANHQILLTAELVNSQVTGVTLP